MSTETTNRLAHTPSEEAFGLLQDTRAEVELRSADPAIIVTDFGNHLSPAECEVIMGKIYRSRGFRYETPHGVDDVEGFDFTDGGYQLRQLAIDLDRPLDSYDIQRAIVDLKPGVFGTVVDPGVGTARRIVVVETKSGNRYVGPDNGVLSPALAREEVTAAYAVKDEIYQNIAATFHGRDLILPTVARLACGDKPSEMDYLDKIDDLTTLAERTIPENMVVHVDGYGGRQGERNYGGNVKFEQEGFPLNSDGERPTGVKLTLPRVVWYRGLPRRHIDAMVGRTIADAPPMHPIFYTGSSGESSGNGNGHVEFAVNGGKGKRSAAGRFKLYPGDEVGFAWRYDTEDTSSRRSIFSRARRSV